MLSILCAPLLLLLPHLPVGGVVPTPAAAGSLSSLERGLSAIDADNITADIEFIGSDALGGRDTPSNGLQVAARYLRARLQRLGWEPGAEDGFLYRYELAYNRIDDEASIVEVKGPGGGHTFKYGVDYFLASSRSVKDLEFESEAVFCGGGSEDELEGVDLDGRWALCLDGSVHWRKRMRACQDAGAGGIVTLESAQSDETFAERFKNVLKASRRAKVGWPKAAGDEERPFPLIYLSAAEAQLAQWAGVEGALADVAVGTKLDLTVRENRARFGENGRIELENVCGFWRGADPELSKEVILVSAHYDHVGTKGDDIYNGADDNGSGTAGLLALAEGLAEYGPMRRSVMLIWVSGEEKGLLGSKAWATNPWLPEGCRAVANINIDMIGRNAADSLLITPTQALEEHYNGLTKLADELAPLEGFAPLGSADAYWSRSDHAMFAKLGIPVAFLFSDVHEDYHKPTDTPDKINSDKIRRVARLVLRVLEGLQTDYLDL